MTVSDATYQKAAQAVEDYEWTLKQSATEAERYASIMLESFRLKNWRKSHLEWAERNNVTPEEALKQMLIETLGEAFESPEDPDLVEEPYGGPRMEEVK